MRKFLIAICLVFAAPFGHAPALADTKVIAALGDSLTQGYGLPDGDGFVPQMQNWLAARGHDVRLINAGVSGDTTAGGLARINWTLTDEVDAVMVALGGNDLLRALPVEMTAANIHGIAAAVEARDLPLLLVGFKAPGNYGPDYQRDFDAIYPGVATEFGAVYAPEFLGGLRALGLAEGRALMQPDGIHPAKAGVAVIVETLGPSFEALLARIN